MRLLYFLFHPSSEAMNVARSNCGIGTWWCTPLVLSRASRANVLPCNSLTTNVPSLVAGSVEDDDEHHFSCLVPAERLCADVAWSTTVILYKKNRASNLIVFRRQPTSHIHTYIHIHIYIYIWTKKICIYIQRESARVSERERQREQGRDRNWCVWYLEEQSIRLWVT